MKNRIILGIIIFLVLGATAKRGYTTTIGGGGLPDLVIKSDIIATGTITFEDGKTILITDRILKGQAPKRLNLIVNINQCMEGAVSLVEYENVLLFMKSIDADSAYLTSGFLAKWPRNTISEYSTIIDKASVESIAGLVNQILRIESKTDIKDRVGILRNWFDSSDSLLNLIALQYALSSHIWPKEFSPDYQTGIDKTTIRKQLSGYAFKLIQSDDPLIQTESIRLLRYADPERALPVLISKITDPNKNLRSSTFVVLRSLARQLDIGEAFDYDSNSPPDELLSFQRKWQEWYDDANFNR